MPNTFLSLTGDVNCRHGYLNKVEDWARWDGQSGIFFGLLGMVPVNTNTYIYSPDQPMKVGDHVLKPYQAMLASGTNPGRLTGHKIKCVLRSQKWSVDVFGQIGNTIPEGYYADFAVDCKVSLLQYSTSYIGYFPVASFVVHDIPTGWTGYEIRLPTGVVANITDYGRLGLEFQYIYGGDKALRLGNLPPYAEGTFPPSGAYDPVFATSMFGGGTFYNPPQSNNGILNLTYASDSQVNWSMINGWAGPLNEWSPSQPTIVGSGSQYYGKITYLYCSGCSLIGVDTDGNNIVLEEYSRSCCWKPNDGYDDTYGRLDVGGGGLDTPPLGSINDINLYTQGANFSSGDIPFCISGVPWSANSINLITFGGLPSSGDISLYMVGTNPSSGTIDLFLQCNYSSGYIPLYIEGYEYRVTSSLYLSVLGPILPTGTNNIPFYTRGFSGSASGETTKSVDLFLQVDPIFNWSLNLYTSGADYGGSSGILNLAIYGINYDKSADINFFLFNSSSEALSGVYLYTRGLGVNEGYNVYDTSLNLYLERWPSNSIDMFLACSTGGSGNMNLYTGGYAASSGIINLVLPSSYAVLNTTIPFNTIGW